MEPRTWTVLRAALVALVVLCVMPVSASAQDAPGPAAQRIATVDLQRALLTVEDGRDARTTLEAEMQRRQAEFEDAQASLESDAAAFEASMSMLTEDAAMERYQELQARAMQLERQYGTHQQELARMESEATAGIAERMIGIVQSIAEERGYDLVIDVSSVVYVNPTFDVTEELVRRYDEQY